MRRAAFEAWCAEQGEPLTRFAVWETLVARYGRDRAAWPQALRSPGSPDIALFAAAESDEIGYAHVPAVAGRNPAPRGRRGRRRARRAAVPRPRGRRRRERGRRLGRRAGVRARGLDRRPARHPQHPRAGLGPAAARPARLGPRRLRRAAGAARRELPRRRRAADRPRHVAGAPVLDPARPRPAQRHLRRLRAGRHARDRRAGQPARALRRDRRGPGHRAGRLPRGDGGDRHPVVPHPLVRAHARTGGSSRPRTTRRWRWPPRAPTTCPRSRPGCTPRTSSCARSWACSRPRSTPSARSASASASGCWTRWSPTATWPRRRASRRDRGGDRGQPLPGRHALRHRHGAARRHAGRAGAGQRPGNLDAIPELATQARHAPGSAAPPTSA